MSTHVSGTGARHSCPLGEGPVASAAREAHSPLSGSSGCGAVTAPPLAGRAVTVTSEARTLGCHCPDGGGHVCLGEAGTGLGRAGAGGAPCSGRWRWGRCRRPRHVEPVFLSAANRRGENIIIFGDHPVNPGNRLNNECLMYHVWTYYVPACLLKLPSCSPTAL